MKTTTVIVCSLLVILSSVISITINSAAPDQVETPSAVFVDTDLGDYLPGIERTI